VLAGAARTGVLPKVRNYLNALSNLRISHLRPAFESSPGYLGVHPVETSRCEPPG
jgi:hypothetical protein